MNKQPLLAQQLGVRTCHLRMLARGHGVRYRCYKNSPLEMRVSGQAHVQGDLIEVYTHGQDIEDEEAYFVALHELAHVVQHHNIVENGGWSNRTGRIVEAEAEAWCWALENALQRPSWRVAETISARVWSYYRSWILAVAKDDLFYADRVRAREVPDVCFRRLGRLIHDQRMASFYLCCLPKRWRGEYERQKALL